MAFIAAKCPACGGEIQLDNARESGFCVYCGVKVLLEEAIPKKVVIEGLSTLDTKLKNAEAYIKIGEYQDAEKEYKHITKEFTSDYRAWWELAKLKIIWTVKKPEMDVGLIDRIANSKEYHNAIALANDEQKELIAKEYEPYRKRVEANVIESKRKVEATVNGDYQYINHSHFLRMRLGIELIDGTLYYWSENGRYEYEYPFWTGYGTYDFKRILRFDNTGRMVVEGQNIEQAETLLSIHNNEASFKPGGNADRNFDYIIEAHTPSVIVGKSPYQKTKKKQSLSSWFFGV